VKIFAETDPAFSVGIIFSTRVLLLKLVAKLMLTTAGVFQHKDFHEDQVQVGTRGNN